MIKKTKIYKNGRLERLYMELISKQLRNSALMNADSLDNSRKALFQDPFYSDNDEMRRLIANAILSYFPDCDISQTLVKERHTPSVLTIVIRANSGVLGYVRLFDRFSSDWYVEVRVDEIVWRHHHASLLRLYNVYS